MVSPRVTNKVHARGDGLCFTHGNGVLQRFIKLLLHLQPSYETLDHLHCMIIP